MTTPMTTQHQDSSLARDLIYAARYYLWHPRVLLTLATIAIVAGLVFNWSWLVAAGLAPILISTLPCLVMCAFGVCMMCRSGEKQSAPARGVAEAARPPNALAVVATDKPSTGTNLSTAAPHSIEAAVPPMSLETDPRAVAASCRQGSMNEANRKQTVDLQAAQERRNPHAQARKSPA